MTEESSGLAIIVVLSSPAVTSDGSPLVLLNVYEEWQRIASKMQSIPVRLVRCAPSTVSRLGEIAAGCQILHFVGHALPGSLVFEDEVAQADLVDAERLAPILHNSGARLVVLNACDTATDSAAVASLADELCNRGVPCVIGTTDAVKDRLAVLFADSFYGGLASHLSALEALNRFHVSVSKELSGAAHELFRLRGNGDEVLFPPSIPATKGSIEFELPPGNLPYNQFYVGRPELPLLMHRLLDSQVRIGAISGIGGVGKTSLALEASFRAAHRFRGGVVFIRAGEPTDFSLDYMVARIVESLRVRPPADYSGDLEAFAVDHLNQNSVLVLLDDLDTVDEKRIREVASFFAGVHPASGTKLLITCREHPGYLDRVEGAFILDLGRMDPRAAVLFVQEIAASADSKIAWLQEEAEALNFAQACDFHPYLMLLAAKRAARRERQLVLAEIRGLTGPTEAWARIWIDRQLELAGPLGLDFLRRLTIFPRSAAWEAVVDVCGDAVDVNRARELVDAAGLLEVRMPLGRVSLPPLVRALLAKRNPLSQGEREELQARHAAFFSKYSSTLAERITEGNLGGLSGQVNEDLSDLRVAAEWLEDRDAKTFLSFCGNLDGPAGRLGFWTLRLELMRRAYEVAKASPDPTAVADFSYRLTAALVEAGDYPAAIGYCEESLAESRKLGDLGWIAASLHLRGVIAEHQGEYADALKHYGEAVSIRTSVGDEIGMAASEHHLGIVARLLGDPRGAREAHERALAIQRRLHDDEAIAKSLHQLGILARLEGDFAGCRTYHNESLAISRRLDDQSGVARSLYQLGVLSSEEGDHASSVRLCKESLAISERIGDQYWIAKAVYHLANLKQEEGDLEASNRLYKRTLDIAERMGDKHTAANVLFGLGSVARQQRDWLKAREFLNRSLALGEELDDRRHSGLTEVQLGLLAADQGDHGVALQWYDSAAQDLNGLPDADEVAAALDELKDKMGEHDFRALLRRFQSGQGPW